LAKFPEDAAERELLRALQQNSQRSLRELSRELGLPISTVHEKIKRLEREGLIRGYRAILDEKKLGFGVTGFVLVSVNYMNAPKTTQAEIAEKAAKLPNVQEVHIIAGEWDFLVKAKARSVEELGKLVTEKLRNIPGVEKTLSIITYETVREDALLSL
jgi:Lrp/AsnC family leucine-responsive transcriptional regulator